eukprot:scaffold64466_cov24-Tisochrysis_lutea.AAC.5
MMDSCDKRRSCAAAGGECRRGSNEVASGGKDEVGRQAGGSARPTGGRDTLALPAQLDIERASAAACHGNEVCAPLAPSRDDSGRASDSHLTVSRVSSIARSASAALCRSVLSEAVAETIMSSFPSPRDCCRWTGETALARAWQIATTAL